MEEKQPARRKDKNNPYKIYKDNGSYFITFKDSQNITVTLEIDEALFNLFNKFELEDLIYLNEFDRHEEHLVLSEQDLNKRAYEIQLSVDDTIIERLQNESLKNAILDLPEVQRRRLILYYFEDMTYEEIAKVDGCKYQAVQCSVYQALKKLRNKLKKNLT